LFRKKEISVSAIDTLESERRMKRKAVSRIMLTFLLISTLISLFRIELVKATGTIYIRADGSIAPPTASITSIDNVTYTFTGNINESIVVERDNIVIDGAGYRLYAAPYPGGIGLNVDGRSNVTIKNMEIFYFNPCIYLGSSANITICGNTIYGYPEATGCAIRIVDLSNGNISGNSIPSGFGIGVQHSLNTTTISGNNIGAYIGGMSLSSSNNNTISGNRITTYTGSCIHLSSSYNTTISGNNLQDSRSPEDCVCINSGSFNTISGNTIGGVWLTSSSFNTISENTIWYDVTLTSSSLNTIHGNIMGDVHLSSSSNNTFSKNNINSYVTLTSSYNNKFYHNNFIYSHCVHSENSTNMWDDGYPSGGNYWSDYTGVDLYSGPFQNETGSDGIGDTPYLIAQNNRDNYPFMDPYYDFDIAITNVSPSKTVVAQGRSLLVNVTVENQGVLPVTFNLTLNATYIYTPVQIAVLLQASAAQGWNYSMPGPPITAYLGDTIALTLEAVDSVHHKFYVDYNGNAFPDSNEPQSSDFMFATITFNFTASISGNFTYYCAYNQDTMFGPLTVNPEPHWSTQITQNLTLASKEEKNVTFTWNTTSFAKGNYTISAYAWPVPGETDTTDNTFKDGCVLVTVPGDVDGNGECNILDVKKVKLAYSGWIKEPNADIDDNGEINILDLKKEKLIYSGML